MDRVGELDCVNKQRPTPQAPTRGSCRKGQVVSLPTNIGPNRTGTSAHRGSRGWHDAHHGSRVNMHERSKLRQPTTALALLAPAPELFGSFGNYFRLKNRSVPFDKAFPSPADCPCNTIKSRGRTSLPMAKEQGKWIATLSDSTTDQFRAGRSWLFEEIIQYLQLVRLVDPRDGSQRQYELQVTTRPQQAFAREYGFRGTGRRSDLRPFRLRASPAAA